MQDPHHPIRSGRVTLRAPAIEGWDRIAVERWVRKFDSWGFDLNASVMDDFGGPGAKDYMKLVKYMRMLQKALRDQREAA